MTRWGIGPRYAIFSAAFTVAMLAVNYGRMTVLSIPHHPLAVLAGRVLTVRAESTPSSRS